MKSPATRIAALAAFVRKLLLIAATLIAGAELVGPGAVHDILRRPKSELITQPARTPFGRIGSERTSAVQRALPTACWEIFPTFDELVIGNSQPSWGSVASGFAPAIANSFDASRPPQSRKLPLVRPRDYTRFSDLQSLSGDSCLNKDLKRDDDPLVSSRF